MGFKFDIVGMRHEIEAKTETFNIFLLVNGVCLSFLPCIPVGQNMFIVIEFVV